MDRKEKIRLLRDLQSGAISIDALKPKDLKIYIDVPPPHGTGTKYYIGGREVDQGAFRDESDRQRKTLEGITVKLVSYRGDEE